MHFLHIHTIFKNAAQASTQPLNHWTPPSRGPLTRLLSASASPPNRPLPLGPPRRGSPLGRLPEGTPRKREKCSSTMGLSTDMKLGLWLRNNLPSHNAQVLLKGLVVQHIYTCIAKEAQKPAATALWEIMCTIILSQKISWTVLSQGLNSIWSCLSCCTCLWWVIAPSTRASTITKAEFHMQQSNVTKFALRKSWACGNWFFRFGEAELHHLHFGHHSHELFQELLLVSKPLSGCKEWSHSFSWIYPQLGQILIGHLEMELGMFLTNSVEYNHFYNAIGKSSLWFCVCWSM